MKAFLFPYKPFSESGKALSEALGIKRISHRNSKFKGNADKVVINWGSSVLPEEVAKCRVINTAEAVAIASDKLKTFQAVKPQAVGKRLVIVGGREYKLPIDHSIFDDVADDFVGDVELLPLGKVNIVEPVAKPRVSARIPDFTTSIDVAYLWLEQGHTVVERHILNANSGKGIRLVEPEDEDGLQACPLYVKYVPKKQEYRVHVCAGKAVDIQRKARRKDVEDDAINWKIRNHDNGFIFARNEDAVVPEDVTTQAVNAVLAIGLEFGAVDVIFNEKEQKAYVLEVNTAPGLAGSTLEGYVERLKKLVNGEPLVEKIVAAEAPVGAPVARLPEWFPQAPLPAEVVNEWGPVPF